MPQEGLSEEWNIEEWLHLIIYYRGSYYCLVSSYVLNMQNKQLQWFVLVCGETYISYAWTSPSMVMRVHWILLEPTVALAALLGPLERTVANWSPPSLTWPRLVKLSSTQFSSQASNSKISSKFWAKKGHRCNPKTLRIFFTPMTPSKNDPRPPKKKFSYILPLLIYKKFFISGLWDQKCGFFFATP